ncbi:putative monooxygenase [Mycena sanguinolenta]|nr:putative monooxygenase [Mycena sanguinolenta]
MATSGKIAITLACIFVLSALLSRSRKNKKGKLPPGPARLPLIGSALHIPQKYQWLTFSKWADEYGDVVYLEAVGQPMVLLNTAKAAKDLLEQRSAIYSDRPQMEMAYLSGYDKALVLQPYNDTWRQQRKIVMQDLAPRMIPRYYALQEAEARLLAKDVLENPSQLEQIVKRRIGTIIIRITYGHYITADDDAFLTGGRAAMDIFSASAEPGVWLVDSVPLLKYFPAWLPGMRFLATAKAWREIVHKAAWEPYLWSKRALESGSVLMPNTCATALESVDGKPSPAMEEQCMLAAFMMLEGGTDTSMTSTLSFFLAMLRNPAVQAKAQAEIDEVIGKDRLPTIADKDSLPYVRSVVTEVFRLHPAIPLGIPHALTQDDVYQGMYLSKGSVVIPNVWHMLHDPAIYANPMSFDPDRYNLDDSEMAKVTDLVFGFGRRLCPGKSFGEGNVFAIAATLLATCDIGPPVGGVEEVVYSSGSISFPSPFGCTVKPRSKQAFELLSHSVGGGTDSSFGH